jgi:hypothetical protein
MNMKSKSTRVRLTVLAMVAVLAVVSMDGSWVTAANAQCTTCATPTVAYMPVTYAVYQPVATEQTDTGWYLGRWFDRRRAKRQAAANATATTYSAGYVPYTAGYTSYTAGYTPYTAAYAPVTTVAYQPYVTAYAPLAQTVVARPVVQTAYSLVVSSGCQSCVTPTATLKPMVASGCSTCDLASPIGGCSTYSAGASPAIYMDSSSSCSGCASTSTGPIYSGGTIDAGSSMVGPATPQPQLAPQPTTPVDSTYKAKRPQTPATTPTQPTAPAQTQPTAPTPGSGPNAAAGSTTPTSPVPSTDGKAPYPAPAPQPESAEAADSNTYLAPPRLLDPADRSARRPSTHRSQVNADVHTAIYQKPVSSTTASSQFIWQTANPQRSQAEIDADGWQSVRH